jgi:hypothetical protein
VFFNLVATETITLFEHLSSEFLAGFNVFALPRRGRTRGYQPLELFRVFRYSYYKDINGVRPVSRELQTVADDLQLDADLKCNVRSRYLQDRANKVER